MHHIYRCEASPTSYTTSIYTVYIVYLPLSHSHPLTDKLTLPSRLSHLPRSSVWGQSYRPAQLHPCPARWTPLLPAAGYSSSSGDI